MNGERFKVEKLNKFDEFQPNSNLPSFANLLGHHLLGPNASIRTDRRDKPIEFFHPHGRRKFDLRDNLRFSPDSTTQITSKHSVHRMLRDDYS
jgi:hypothetical protein